MLPRRIANPGDGRRRGRLNFFLAFVATLLFAHGFARAQSTLLQGGAWTPGHAPQYIGQGSSQAVVIDGGTAGGGANGANLSEIGITSRDPQNSYPSANSGTGAFGSHGCLYDAPITNSTGYHFLCFDPDALGGGLISYGAGGTASQLPLQCNVNGVLTQCLGATTAPLTFTDGTNTVTPVTHALFVGATISGTTPNAIVTIDTQPPTGISVMGGVTLINDVTELSFVGCTVSGTTPNATATCDPPGIEFSDGVNDVLGAVSLQFINGGITIGGASPNANASFIWANTTDIWTSVAHKFIDPAGANQAIAPTTYAEFGGTFNIAFTNGINGNLALNHTDCPCNIANPTGVYAGLSGNLTLVQSASGSDTVTWSSVWKFSNGVPPTLTTTANAVDVLPYYCRTPSFCVVTFIGNVQ